MGTPSAPSKKSYRLIPEQLPERVVKTLAQKHDVRGTVNLFLGGGERSVRVSDEDGPVSASSFTDCIATLKVKDQVKAKSSGSQVYLVRID